MAESSIADRLRLLKEKKGLTAQAMSEATGVSRRTLESYMRRENPPLPGLETLSQISKGLGVSLDWLILGGLSSMTREILLARVCAERAALPAIRELLAKSRDDQAMIVPELLAKEIGTASARNAVLLAEELATSGQIKGLMDHFEAQTVTALTDKRDAMKAELEKLTSELAKKPE